MHVGTSVMNGENYIPKLHKIKTKRNKIKDKGKRGRTWYFSPQKLEWCTGGYPYSLFVRMK